jgi:hypothetical protein
MGGGDTGGLNGGGGEVACRLGGLGSGRIADPFRTGLGGGGEEGEKGGKYDPALPDGGEPARTDPRNGSGGLLVGVDSSEAELLNDGVGVGGAQW